MVYNANVPASGQSLGETRPTIQGNFADINTAFGANHIALTTSTDGKHKFLQMPEQGAPPSTGPNEGALYTKEDNSITNLFWRMENNGTDGTEVKMTGPAPLKSAKGYTFLPGNLLIEWGYASVPAGSPGTKTVTFPKAFGATPYSVQVTINNFISNSTKAVYTSNIAASQFVIINTDSGNAHNVQYIAIGPIA